ncbi:MAG: ORF6C domain-containing protein [Gilliamella sp.]|uniref:BRO-N domain-containing protein n=1 Tax=Gilliamella sp. TaxID=1891236 RepID=UPI0025F6E80F|nr:BRO family protein [Gilliamella sp.]MCO6550999.1 ORF6C domain-containing protein [Gilliamella sp.]
MSNLSIFNFHQTQVRIQLLNNEPLFCLTDVIKILNIKNANASRFNMSEAGIHKMYIRSGGQNREVTFINEPNLYRVIFRSNKKEAVDFQNWVFDEVLPTIRKTGSYSLTINAEQQQQIQQAVNERVYRTGERHQAVYSKFHQQFKIPRYQDLPASKFNEAIKWLSGVTKTKKDMIEVNRTNLICLVHHMLWLNDFYIDNRLYDVFKMLGSNFGVRLHDHFGDGAFVASMFKQQLEKKQLRQV